MNGYADGSSLVGYSPSDCLTNPPGGIGGKLEPLTVVEFFNGAKKTNIAFLDEI